MTNKIRSFFLIYLILFNIFKNWIQGNNYDRKKIQTTKIISSLTKKPIIASKKEILSNAYLNSQKIRGEADAKATKIYADTYGRSSEFYNFIKSLDTYERTIDSTSTLILSTDNAYLKYLNNFCQVKLNH